MIKIEVRVMRSQAKKCRLPLEAGNKHTHTHSHTHAHTHAHKQIRKKQILPSEPPEAMNGLADSDFSPVRPISGFETPE